MPSHTKAERAKNTKTKRTKTSTDRLKGASRVSARSQEAGLHEQAKHGRGSTDAKARATKNINPSGKTNSTTRLKNSSRIKVDRVANISKIITRLSKTMGKRSVLGGPIMQMAKDAASGKTMRRIQKQRNR